MEKYAGNKELEEETVRKTLWERGEAIAYYRKAKEKGILFLHNILAYFSNK